MGTRPPGPSPLPSKPECGFAARCPGRPGRCAAHVKYTRVQTGEVRARVGLLPCAWAPAVPAGSSTHLSSGGTPSAGAGQYSRSEHRSGCKQECKCVMCVCVCVCVCARARVCVYVCVPVPHLMLGKGIYLWKVCFQQSQWGVGPAYAQSRQCLGSRSPAPG